MITEYSIMKVLQYELKYTIPQLGEHGTIRPLRIVTDVLVTLAFGTHVYFFSTYFHSIWTFIVYMHSLTTWALFAAYLVTHLTGNSSLKEYYKRILKVDGKMNTSLQHQNDWILLLLVGMYYFQFIAATMYMIAREMPTYELPFVAFVPISQEVFSVGILKYLLAKRLRCIRSAEEYLGRIEDTVNNTRKLLQCNKCLNNTYGLLVMAYVILIFQQALLNFYSLWSTFAAKVDLPGEPTGKIIQLVLWSTTNYLSCILLATFSTLLVDEVEEVKLELDITLTARKCTPQQWNLVNLFLMELHHTPVELSAVGFFSIVRPSVTTAFATLVSFLLVLIQYS